MPANPIFGNLGGLGGLLGGWGNYSRSRGVPLNSNPNLSSDEYAARLQSMGNPTNAQSYANYTASDDYAAGWRPTTSGGGIPMGSWYPQGGSTVPTNPSDYLVSTQLNGIPNVIPVGANITDGTTTTTPGTTPTPPATTPPWWQANPFPTTGSVQDIQAWMQQFIQNMGVQAPSGGGGNGGGGYQAGGGPARTPDPWGNTTTNPNNMSYPANYPGIPTGSYVGNPNNMSYIGAQSPTPAQNPTVVQEWANKRKGNGNNKRNR